MNKEAFRNDRRNGFVPIDHDSIGEDYVVFDDPAVFSSLNYPFKLDETLVIICTGGSLHAKVDLREIRETAPFSVTILENQIFTIESFSDDFKGRFTLMSTRFLDSLFINRRKSSSLYLAAKHNPVIRFEPGELVSIDHFHEMIKAAVRMKENPNRIEIVKHLTLAFYYANNHKHFEMTDRPLSRNEILVKDFLDLVSLNFKRHRGMEFYAQKMFLTPKYLSKLIKQTSGKSGNRWINDYVILEAKALLKSTNMTIQQISNELNFANQSFFGSYFKKHVGISPKQYRGADFV